MSFDDVYLSSRTARVDRGTEGVSRRAGAVARTVAGVAGPLVVAVLLPDPHGQFVLLGDPRAEIVIGAVATLIATGIVYLLLVWAAAIVLAALAGRAPGTVGRAGRRALAHITPALVRRVVVTAAGLSIATGLAACGGQPSALPSMTTMPATVQHATQASRTQQPVQPLTFGIDSPAASTTGTSTVPMPAATESDGPAVDLDWPLTTAGSESSPSTPSPSSSTPPPMTAGPASSATRTGDPEPAAQVTAAPETTIPEAAATTPAAHRTTPQASSRPRPPADISGLLVVHRGDSLWSIAAAHLPPEAGAAEIDAAWHAWYQANREVIGSDPGLILPGQQLHAPVIGTATTVSGVDAHGTAPSPSGGMR